MTALTTNFSIGKEAMRSLETTAGAGAQYRQDSGKRGKESIFWMKKTYSRKNPTFCLIPEDGEF